VPDAVFVAPETVSFPLFRSLRQLRRRTIPAPSPSVNRFFEKNAGFLRDAAQTTDKQQYMNMKLFISHQNRPWKWPADRACSWFETQKAPREGSFLHR
jgi:hypothetical protein